RRICMGDSAGGEEVHALVVGENLKLSVPANDLTAGIIALVTYYYRICYYDRDDPQFVGSWWA
ncbi:MAG TPA: hypothetical protein VGO47_01980, partial [Chlamydiales bacterium]|nr:hypothetical protein [Chlamydiales bacterium]